MRQYGPPERMVEWFEAMSPDDLAALTQGLQALAAIVERDTTQTQVTTP